jgi:hypothetical protein
MISEKSRFISFVKRHITLSVPFMGRMAIGPKKNPNLTIKGFTKNGRGWGRNQRKQGFMHHLELRILER